ncbi:hypothetical protein ACTID9_11590 [Brevibacillus fluminis]|uniref:hypothetical protein n=1 Tax=Brevibacillus fluminis TaxID=511487 RepID=UPI003F8BC614
MRERLVDASKEVGENGGSKKTKTAPQSHTLRGGSITRKQMWRERRFRFFAPAWQAPPKLSLHVFPKIPELREKDKIFTT